MKLPIYCSGITEAAFWVAGVVALALMEPEGEHLFSICFFNSIGVDFCPGCGLGHAIAYLFRGEWEASWEAHPLGLPALLILGWRIITLYKHSLFLRSFYLNPT